VSKSLGHATAADADTKDEDMKDESEKTEEDKVAEQIQKESEDSAKAEASADVEMKNED
jgi:hypothetical protein